MGRTRRRRRRRDPGNGGIGTAAGPRSGTPGDGPRARARARGGRHVGTGVRIAGTTRRAAIVVMVGGAVARAPATGIALGGGDPVPPGLSWSTSALVPEGNFRSATPGFQLVEQLLMPPPRTSQPHRSSGLVGQPWSSSSKPGSTRSRCSSSPGWGCRCIINDNHRA